MRCKLDDICLKITDGSHYSPADDPTSCIPMLSVKDMEEFDFNYNNCKHISEDEFNKLLKNDCVPKENDVLVAKDGSYLKEIFVNEKENKKAILSSIAIFRPNLKKVDPYFLCYLLKTPKVFNYVKDNCVSGSALPRIILKAFKSIELDIPDLNIQKRIVEIIKTINLKIIVNGKINNNLYEISKQLLSKYLNENSDSEEINISQLLNVFTGKKNANETSPNGKYKFFSCAPESLLSDTYLYDGAAIIVAGNGAYTGRTRFYDGKFELYQRTYGLTLKDGINKNNIYGLYVFMKTVFEPDKMGGTHGSAIPYIVLSDLTDYKLKYNKFEFDKFSDLVSNNIKMIQENEKSNEELSRLRNTLLPKLMNDEIDLDNIEI